MKFRLIESKADIQALIDFAGEDIANIFLKNRNTIKPPYNDIYYWIKRPLPEFEAFILDFTSNASNTKKRGSNKQGAELIYSDDDWKVYHITTYESSVYYGKGTKWCISGSKEWSNGEKSEEYFNQYANMGAQFYFYIKNGTEKYAVVSFPPSDRCKIFNAKDDEIQFIIDAPIIKELPKKISSVSHSEFEIMDYNKMLYKFNNIHNKSNIVLPDSIKTIGEWVFNDSGVITVIVPEGVEEIYQYAFRSCKTLEKVVLPSTLDTVDGWSFTNCVNLKTVEFKEGLHYIGDVAFGDCPSLSNIIIPKSVRNIENLAFRGVAEISVYKDSYAEEYCKKNSGKDNFKYKVI